MPKSHAMKQSEFHHRSRIFIESLLRQRDYLTITHKGKKNLSDVSAASKFIRLHLEANGYRDNRQMANFWAKHQDKIMILLPGIGSPSHLSMLEHFNKLTWEAGLYQPTLFKQLSFSDYSSAQ